MLHGFKRPVIEGLTYSTDDDFRVVESRYNLFRQCMDNTMHTFCVMQSREIYQSNGRDRCGYLFGYRAVIAFIKKLSTRPEAYEPGLPAAHKEIDAAIEFVEWTQEKLAQNIRIMNRAVTAIDIGEVPVQDALGEGMFLAEVTVEYG